MREIQESITISAPPSQVWRVLMDLNSWSKWNTFVTSIEVQAPHNELAVGSKQTITIDKTQSYTNVVSVLQPEKELRWNGSILKPIIFDTEHWCCLEAVEEGRSTRFTQGERFSGILAPIAAAAGKLNELQEGYKPTIFAFAMDPSETLPWSLAITLLFIPGCLAAEFGDDFANNLFTDLAPLIALFGERVTMQYMSQATGWADSFTLAMAPLGILTIIVSAIRVGGPSWLKAIIGRARENLAAAEVELMSSTSQDVCELWNGSEIVRSLGSPPPNWSFANNTDLKGSQDIELKELNESNKVIIIYNESTSAPNISLNVHPQKRHEVRMAAILGTLLQVGVLVYAGFATYYYTMKFPKEENKPVSNYAFPCTASGTIFLVTGLLLCADVVEKRTAEVARKPRTGYEAYAIWVQREATVGD
ncbi:ankyrin repeat [Fusarium pseudocircinatum]|uniref:Ankyrin repeat n=1 Tax=Fusarium pseudocircinatum TaxID=56676 RepID=A0A8H5PK01_9HYPO|nr:ankyrin repeat [Fusarium pseudocircinatum]